MGYEPLGVYDAPGVMLAQILEGEATPRTLVGAAIDPDRLTPWERTDLGDMFAGSGAGRLQKTLMGIATNPWVWLLFITGPVGREALKAGKPLSFVKKQYASYVRNSSGLLDRLRTDLQAFRGTPLPEHALTLGEETRKALERPMMHLAKAREGVFKRLNQILGREGQWRDTLEPHKYPVGSPEREVLERFNTVAAVKGFRLDQHVEEGVLEGSTRFGIRRGGSDRIEKPLFDPLFGESEAMWSTALKTAQEKQKALRTTMRNEFFEVDAGGSLTARARELHNTHGSFDRYWAEHGMEIVPVGGSNTFQRMERSGLKTQKPLADAADEAWAQFGPEGEAYIEAAHIARQEAYVRALGQEGVYENTGAFVADETKMRGWLSSLNREMGKDGTVGQIDAGSTTVQGKELLMGLLGSDGVQTLRATANVEDQIKILAKRLEEIAAPTRWDDRWWTPHNTYEIGQVIHEGKRTTPTIQLNDLEQRALAFAPWSASNELSARVLPLTAKETLYSPEFLQKVDKYVGLTSEGRDTMQRMRDMAQDAWAKDRKAVLFLREGLEEGTTKHVHDLHIMAAIDTVPAPASALAADELYRANIPSDTGGRTWKLAGGHTLKASDPIPEHLVGQVTMGDLIDRQYVAHRSKAHQMRIRNSVVPNALNVAGPEWLAVQNAAIANKEMAGWFANGFIGRAVEKFGGKWGADLIEDMRKFADFNNRTGLVDWSGKAAGYLYTAHLGLNMGSVVLNLTQPLLLAATAGTLPEVMGAYTDAIQDVGRYVSKRASLGFRATTPAEKMALIKESFPFADFEGKNLMGIGPHVEDVLESGLRAQSPMGKVSQGMMSLFEKSEWFNRSFSAHLMKRIYQGAGIDLRTGMRAGQRTAANFAQDTEAFILRTQYGQTPVNTPEAFQKGIMRNPLARQFLTFPLRSLMGVVDEFPLLGGQDYWTGLARTVGRGMGMSALVYEVGKGMMGADLSRGLFAGAATSLVGGDRLLEKGGPIVPAPPLLSIPVDFMRAVAADDMALLGQSVARVVPGGVAINRALQIAPEMPEMGWANGLPGRLQKTYVDYKNPLPTGEVPVYRGDGMLVAYRRPAEVVAKAFGVDLGTWEQQGGLDNYLVKQRDEVLKYRQEYLRAVASNEFERAAQVQADFTKRFKGLPLTVTQEQAEQFLNNRVVGRTERTLDRIPPEVRWHYQKMVEASGRSPDLPPGAIPSAPTSRGRERIPQAREDEARLMELIRRQQGPVRPEPAFGSAPFAR